MGLVYLSIHLPSKNQLNLGSYKPWPKDFRHKPSSSSSVAVWRKRSPGGFAEPSHDVAQQQHQQQQEVIYVSGGLHEVVPGYTVCWWVVFNGECLVAFAPQEGWFNGTRITTIYKGSFLSNWKHTWSCFFQTEKVVENYGLVSPQKDRVVGFLANGRTPWLINRGWS